MNQVEHIFEMDRPFRLRSPREISLQEFDGAIAALRAADVGHLNLLLEKTNAVLDRMEDVEQDGPINPRDVEEIVRGIMVLEEILTEKMSGKKSHHSYKKAEAI